MTRPPLALWLYLALTRFAGPLWALALRRRARKGREDPARMAEKLGRYTRARPDGPLIWFHAVSVGEAQALVTLLDHLTRTRPDLHVLLTTHTLTSAQVLAGRGLPDRVIHQFAPGDFPAAVDRFLNHWRPDASVIAEADLWPWLLRRTDARGIPLMLVNTHVTARRWRRRRRIVASNAALLRPFRAILVQDADSLDRYAALGADPARLALMGVLKAAADPLPDRPEARAALAAQIGARPVWLAASTKTAEEPLLLEAHAAARAALPDLLLILAPRQPQEAGAVEGAARTLFGNQAVARRSTGAAITGETTVYIADTVGEMGLWYRLAPVAYTGQSLPVPGVTQTGKNPFEAAALGAMVLHGPQVGNFTDAYAQLAAEGGAVLVSDPAGLARAVIAAQDPDSRAPVTAGAARVIAANRRPLDVALAATLALLDGRPILAALPADTPPAAPRPLSPGADPR